MEKTKHVLHHRRHPWRIQPYRAILRTDKATRDDTMIILGDASTTMAGGGTSTKSSVWQSCPSYCSASTEITKCVPEHCRAITPRNGTADRSMWRTPRVHFSREKAVFEAGRSKNPNFREVKREGEKRLYNKSWGKEQKSGQSKPNQVKWKCKNPQPEEGILCPRKIIAQNS